MSIISAYKALSATSTSGDVQQVLNSIINAPPGRILADDRIGLVKLILEDLADKTKNGRLSSKDRPLALTALKVLGRSPDSAQIIATKPSLELLLSLADVSQDVARTIANALLLHAQGRQNFIDVNGGDYAVNLLSSSSDPTSLFLACRLLFLCTHDSSSTPFMEKLLNETNILEVTVTKMELLRGKVRKEKENADQAGAAKDALTDMMKFVYNMTLHYSRSVGGDDKAVYGDVWSDKFSPWVAPLLRTFATIPYTLTPPIPLSSPMTHCIHCLLSVPIEGYTTAWYSRPTAPEPPADGSLRSRARSFFSSSSQSNSPTSQSGENGWSGEDNTLRAYELVKSCLEHYFSSSSSSAACDVDSREVRDRASNEGVTLEELLAPPVLLLRKMVEGDVTARTKIRNLILPDDLDRTSPLESRPDMLGILIRLLSSVHFPRLQNVAGELLFSLCDSDSSALCAQIGYGNAAGFLFNKGILSAPPPNKRTSSGAGGGARIEEINPITGMVYGEDDGKDLEEMTEEEKEREAEKLFVLFDRLEKKGIAENPIRKAQQEGKLEQYK